MPVELAMSLYARTLTEPVAIRRYTGAGPNRPYNDYPTRARVNGDRAEQLIGTNQEYNYSAILSAPDLVNAGFGLPVTNSDKLIWRGRECAIVFPDAATRSDPDGTVLLALELKIKG